MKIKCVDCGKDVKVQDARFCPFCGGNVEEIEESAGYTRGEFFSHTGDEHFKAEWEKVKNMGADEALSWLRGNPPACFVYCILSEWKHPNGRSKNLIRWMSKDEIKNCYKEAVAIYPKKKKLTVMLLSRIGTDAFWTKEECESVIREEMVDTLDET